MISSILQHKICACHGQGLSQRHSSLRKSRSIYGMTVFQIWCTYLSYAFIDFARPYFKVLGEGEGSTKN